jgi:tetratricopeptide (TPR) repeat protein
VDSSATWRIVVVALAAVLVSVVAIRNAVVQALAEKRPELAAEVWPSHPRVATQISLIDIGRATAEGRPPDATVFRRLNAVLARDPLAAEPFLVAGTNAFSQGQLERAGALLREAARRDPRSPAARYLLADLYLRQGRTADGLRQVGALIRRLPKAAGPLTPSLAAFATQPGAADQVRAILSENPQLRGNVLATLAENPANAALILDLAGEQPPFGPPPDWQSRLVQSLVQAGDYRRAYQLWARFAGVAPYAQSGLFNASFDSSRAPPPFNWTLAAGAAGIAEAAPNGGLRILFYGREAAVLAAQLMLLRPGRYRLRYRLSGSPPNDIPLSWGINCLPGNEQVAETAVADGGDLTFTLGAGCRAQELQLRGSPAELPANVDLTITGLELVREGAG